MSECNWVAQSEGDDGCGGTAVKDFHKFLRICFFII